MTARLAEYEWFSKGEMKLSGITFLRRIINSPYHPFYVKSKPDVWQKREQLRRFVAVCFAFKKFSARLYMVMILSV